MNVTAAALVMGLVLVAAAGPVDAAGERKVLHVHPADEFDVERALEALTVGLADEAGLVLVVVQPTAPTEADREAPNQQQQQTQSQQNTQVVTQNVVVRGGAPQTVVVRDAGTVGLTARGLSDEPTRVTLVVKNLNTGDVINRETFFIGDHQQHLTVDTKGEKNVVVVAQTQNGEAALNVAAHGAAAEQDSPEIEVDSGGGTIQDLQTGITDDSVGTSQGISQIDDSPTIRDNEGPVLATEDSPFATGGFETFNEDFTAIDQETSGDNLFGGSSLGTGERVEGDGVAQPTPPTTGRGAEGLAGLRGTPEGFDTIRSGGSDPHGGLGGLQDDPYWGDYGPYPDTTPTYDTGPAYPTYDTSSGYDTYPTYDTGPAYETYGDAGVSGGSGGYETFSTPDPYAGTDDGLAIAWVSSQDGFP